MTLVSGKVSSLIPARIACTLHIVKAEDLNKCSSRSVLDKNSSNRVDFSLKKKMRIPSYPNNIHVSFIVPDPSKFLFFFRRKAHSKVTKEKKTREDTVCRVLSFLWMDPMTSSDGGLTSPSLTSFF